MQRSEWRYVLALLVFTATPALADWKQDYARGLEAAKDGRWEDVDRYMNSALAGNAEPAKRVRLYGQRFETYAPQHFAGLAALRLGNCGKALSLWSQGGNASIVSADSTLANEESQGRVECSSRLVRNGETLKSENPPVIVKETPRPAPIPQPPRPTPTPIPIPTPPPRPVAQEQPPTRPPIVETSAPTSVSAQILRPLVDAYLSGRYNDVLKLSNQVPPAPRLRWHMLTLRAAAAYNLSQLGQSADAAGIARTAADQARSAEPSLKPDSEYFSPKFIRFFGAR